MAFYIYMEYIPQMQNKYILVAVKPFPCSHQRLFVYDTHIPDCKTINSKTFVFEAAKEIIYSDAILLRQKTSIQTKKHTVCCVMFTLLFATIVVVLAA